MGKKVVFISFICAIIMTLIDGVIKPPYFVKSGIKVIFFLIFPILFIILNKDNSFKEILRPSRKGLKISLVLGFAVYVIIILGYYLFKDIFDFSNITKTLTEDIGVNKDNFIYVALYISLCNSLLEEFFFRGFVFLNLKKSYSRKFSYVFSAGIFTFYHIGMINSFGGIFMILIMLIGLFVGGIIFTYLNEKNNNIYTSWIVHLSANLAINTIGCILFGIIG